MQPVPLIALHGFFGAPADFDPIWPDLAGLPITALALDMPGHRGIEEGEDAFDLEDFFKKINEISQKKPFILLGYSMGGRLALQYAAHFPERLKGLVLIGAQPGLQDPEERRLRVAQDEALASHIEAIGVEDFWKEWAQTPLIATQQSIPDDIKENLVKSRLQHHAKGLANSLRHWGAGHLPSMWPKLRAITCPVLLVTGEEDDKFTKISKKMRPFFQNATCITLPDAGHMAHLENRGAFSKALRDFLDDTFAKVSS
jgi:2-succinyl-6-hydroxy-2,4-cyclohexadiene-1-carboxylate synthase